MRLGPLSRRELVACLRRLGFDAPESGGKHQFMLGRGRRVILPNPHHDELGRAFVLRLLEEAGVRREEWEAL